MLNKKFYKIILIYLLFYNQKSSKTIYFNLRNNNFIIIFKCKMQKGKQEIKKQRKRCNKQQEQLIKKNREYQNEN